MCAAGQARSLGSGYYLWKRSYLLKINPLQIMNHLPLKGERTRDQGEIVKGASSIDLHNGGLDICNTSATDICIILSADICTISLTCIISTTDIFIIMASNMSHLADGKPPRMLLLGSQSVGWEFAENHLVCLYKYKMHFKILALKTLFLSKEWWAFSINNYL